MKAFASNSESSVAISLHIFARKEGFIWNDLPTYYKSRDIQSRLKGAAETFRDPGAIKRNYFQCVLARGVNSTPEKRANEINYFSRGYKST